MALGDVRAGLADMIRWSRRSWRRIRSRAGLAQSDVALRAGMDGESPNSTRTGGAIASFTP